MDNSCIYILAGIFALFGFAIEFSLQTQAYNISSLRKSVVDQDQYNFDSDTDGRIVSITNAIPGYGVITDFEFNIQESAAYMKRHVEYCQWDEYITNSPDNKPIYNYRKGWETDQISSKEFHNFRHRNPKRDEMVEIDAVQPFFAGYYTVDQSLITKYLNQLTFVPNMTQLETFTTSKAQQQFRYIGRGIFYSEEKHGFSPVLRQHLGNDVNGILPDKQIDKLLKDCNPGDMKVYFTVFNPSTVSLTGYRHGKAIYKGDCSQCRLVSGDENPLAGFSESAQSINTGRWFIFVVMLGLIFGFTYQLPTLQSVIAMSVTILAVLLVAAYMNTYILSVEAATYLTLGWMAIAVFRLYQRKQRIDEKNRPSFR